MAFSLDFFTFSPANSHLTKAMAMHYKRLFMSMSIAAVAFAVFNAGAATDVLPGGAINVGSADYFTVLAKGDAGFTDNTITGPSFVTGNYGLGGGKLSITGSSKINGNLVKHSGTQLNTSGAGAITGSITTNDAQLDQAFADAQMLSDTAAAETTTAAYASLTSVNKSMTISGGPGEKVVLNLQDFKLDGGSTFTLQGTATTSFIINVTKRFALTGNSQILLSGVPPANVLFNILGKGEQVAFSGKAGMSGILLALNRKVDLSSGHVTGKVIANQVVITSGGSVVTPTTNP
ncbi:MAG TPA: collagen-binding domain-containing protein [Chthoniobacterales bacterium]|nr:collagen-binding domain-containing protein [Chthoniobacterales bacterium]